MDVDDSAVIYMLQLPLNVGGLGAIASGGSNALVLHSVVLLCNVVVRCLSMKCGLEEAITSGGSIFTAGVRLIRGSRVPGM